MNSEQGLRRYLCETAKSGEIQGRMVLLRVLIAEWRTRLGAIPAADWKDPLASAPTECGYSAVPMTRRGQHRNHTSGTYGAMLLEPMAIHLNLPYRWDFRVVTYLQTEIQAPAGEAFMHRISLSYFWQTGFNPQVAGLSTDTVLKRTIEERTEWYAGVDLRLYSRKLAEEVTNAKKLEDKAKQTEKWEEECTLLEKKKADLLELVASNKSKLTDSKIKVADAEVELLTRQLEASELEDR